MTREEEIKRYCEEQGFPYGACSGISSVKAIVATEAIKWADKTMKERVLNFIHTYFYEHPHVNCHICADSFESLEEMESELIKTMEDDYGKSTRWDVIKLAVIVSIICFFTAHTIMKIFNYLYK